VFCAKDGKNKICGLLKVLSRMTGRADENHDQHHSSRLHGEIEFQGHPELSKDVRNTVAKKFREFQIVTSHISVYFLQTNQKYWNIMSVICTDGEHLSVLTAV